MSIAADITALLHPVLEAAGIHLDSVTVTLAGRHRVVRVVVDTPVTAAAFEADLATHPIPTLDLDAIADATRRVGDVLDDTDVLGAQPYTLEVSSPGVSRPLREPEHFRRNVGRLVRVELADGRVETGRLVRSTGSEVTLDVPAAKRVPARSVTLALADVATGEVQVEFARTQTALDPAPDHLEET